MCFRRSRTIAKAIILICRGGVRPVGREEAETNTACTVYDLRASDAAPYIPGCHVVIVTTGLVWDQKGQTHSTLNTHMENVDLLISEEAQQDKRIT